MYKLESLLEYKTPRILSDFEIKTDHPILTRRSDLVLINKNRRTCHSENFAIPTEHRMKMKESEKRNKYLHLATEKAAERVTMIPIVFGALGIVPKSLEMKLEELKINGRPFRLQHC